MRRDPLYQPITADQFLSIDFGSDKKFELVDGTIQMMTGGSIAHSRVAGRIFHFLMTHLRGSGCSPYNSDTGILIDEKNVRYPDVSIHCGDHARRENDLLLTLDAPVAIFEVLSPSTSQDDQGQKLAEYRRLISLDTIVFVDPVSELSRVVQRLGPTAWRDDLFAQPHDIELPSLSLSIPHGEIFARD